MVGQAIPERDITKPVGPQQIKFIKDLLTKGVPAFVAKVKAMSEQQRHNVRAASRELLKSGELGDLTSRAEAALKALRGLKDTTRIIPNEEIANDFEEASTGIKRGDVRAVHPERQTLVQRAAAKLAREFGKHVIYLERKDGNDLGFEGVSLRNKYPKHIFLDAGSEHDSRFLVGHELAHHFEKADPEAFRNLINAVRPFLNKTEWEKYYNDFRDKLSTDDAVREEVVGNLLGDFLYRNGLPNSAEGRSSIIGFIIRATSTRWKSVRLRRPSWLRPIQNFASSRVLMLAIWTTPKRMLLRVLPLARNRLMPSLQPQC